MLIPPVRELLWLLIAFPVLLAAIWLLDGASLRPLLAATALLLAGLTYGAAQFHRGRRTATDADVEAAAYARVDAALRDTATWNAWCKRTNNGGWAQSSDRPVVRRYLTETLSREERA